MPAVALKSRRGVAGAVKGRFLVLVALLLLIPVAAGASTIADREHVHDRYVIPYNIQLGGVGGGLFQGQSEVYVVYAPVLSDSDHDNNDGAVRGTVTISAYGPGTNIAAQAATISVITTTCLSNTLISSSGGIATTRSHATATYEVRFDNTVADQDKCRTVFRVTQTGATAYVLDIPSVWFNDDPDLNAFEALTGVDGQSFLIFLAVIVLAILFWSRSTDEIVQIFSGVVLALAGAVAIAMYAAWTGWVPFGAVLVVLGAYFIIKSGLEALTSNG